MDITYSIDFDIRIIGVFYGLLFILFTLDYYNKLPEESIPASYGILLGAAMGWGITVLNQLVQNTPILLLFVILVVLLAVQFFTSYRRSQSQNARDIDYIIRVISYENRKYWSAILDSLDRIENAIRKGNAQNNEPKDRDKPS